MSSMPGRRLGMLTPSSNTVLEPVTMAMLADLPDVSAHFSRFRVTQIGLSEEDLDQFSHAEMIRAAELLGDANVDVIAWNGTSASWLGFEHDERLCDEIEDAIKIPGCTSVLAFREIFRRTGVRKVGLVTPYVDDVQQRIARNWAAAGFDCSAERHLGLSENFSFATVKEPIIAGMVRDVAEGCDAVAIVCTNLRGARLAAELEPEIGKPIYDSIAVTIWKCLQLADINTRRLARWGQLFQHSALNCEPGGTPDGTSACDVRGTQSATRAKRG
jgi:maleate isomerase